MVMDTVLTTRNKIFWYDPTSSQTAKNLSSDYFIPTMKTYSSYFFINTFYTTIFFIFYVWNFVDNNKKKIFDIFYVHKSKKVLLTKPFNLTMWFKAFKIKIFKFVNFNEIVSCKQPFIVLKN